MEEKFSYEITYIPQKKNGIIKSEEFHEHISYVANLMPTYVEIEWLFEEIESVSNKLPRDSKRIILNLFSTKEINVDIFDELFDLGNNLKSKGIASPIYSKKINELSN